MASKIVQLKLDTNHIVMRLTDLYHDYEDGEGENEPLVHFELITVSDTSPIYGSKYIEFAEWRCRSISL